MILTQKQELGLRIAVDRYNHNQKYTVIAGYAGAGKSTLVRFIIEALHVPEEQVCFATFTGKAAQVLLKKGNMNVSTLHKLLYKSFPKPDGTFVRIPVEEIPYKVVVVDEVSMAPKALMDLLFTYDVHIICLGDPFQLPPIDKNDDNHLLDNPHIFLDEIMRQAQESEIIRLSMAIRQGLPIKEGHGNEVIVLSNSELNTGMLKWADQILCGTNAKRIDINSQMRGLLGKVGEPQDGDKIICTRNYWDVCADNEDPLINGTIGTLKNSFNSCNYIPKYMGGGKIDTVITDFIADSGSYFNKLEVDRTMFSTGKPTLDWKTSFKLSKNPKTRNLIPLEFDYGYCITGHKSQGSEYEKVLVIEERYPFDREEHLRWLYTCCTRASEKLVLIKK